MSNGAMVAGPAVTPISPVGPVPPPPTPPTFDIGRLMAQLEPTPNEKLAAGLGALAGLFEQGQQQFGGALQSGVMGGYGNRLAKMQLMMQLQQQNYQAQQQAYEQQQAYRQYLAQEQALQTFPEEERARARAMGLGPYYQAQMQSELAAQKARQQMGLEQYKAGQDVALANLRANLDMEKEMAKARLKSIEDAAATQKPLTLKERAQYQQSMGKDYRLAVADDEARLVTWSNISHINPEEEDPTRGGVRDSVLTRMFVQIYDPTSVISGQEEEAAARAGREFPWYGQMRQAVLGGKKLEPEQRRRIMEEIQRIAQKAESRIGATHERYENTLGRFGMETGLMIPQEPTAMEPWAFEKPVATAEAWDEKEDDKYPPMPPGQKPFLGLP